MRGTTWQPVTMSPLGGKELRDARIMAGYPGKAGRVAFATLVGVSPRTVEGWEAKGGQVSGNREALVRKVLAGQGAPTIEAASNMDLLSALAARLAWYEARIAELESHAGQAAAGNYTVNEKGDSIPLGQSPEATSPEGTTGPHSPPRTPRQR